MLRRSAGSGAGERCACVSSVERRKGKTFDEVLAAKLIGLRCLLSDRKGSWYSSYSCGVLGGALACLVLFFLLHQSLLFHDRIRLAYWYLSES